MIKFVKLVNDTYFDQMERKRYPNYSLEEVWVNKANIVKVERNTSAVRLLESGHLPSNLNKNHEFSTITLDNCGTMETLIVVGEANGIATRVLGSGNKVLLKG